MRNPARKGGPRISFRGYWEILSKYLKARKLAFVLPAFLISGTIVLQLANPQIMRAVIDGALAGRAGTTLLASAALFILVALVQQAASVAAAYVGENLAWKATNELRSELADLRRRVALVTQEVQLFQATVRENITFFDRHISDRAIQEAIEKLDLSEWLAGLPSGLDTRLETGGRSLSAGEAQLLAFTRVFLRDPGLIILDEASSRLDPATERLIERAVDKLLENRSAIVIAHRLGTVARADDILILEKGEAAEYGDRRVLAADPESRFSALLRSGMEEMLA